jgi:Radical SAM superfamily
MNQKLRSALRYLLVNSLPDALFDADLSMAETKRMFSSYVKMVEVENHSFCNRTCWFCPNATLDRRSETILMDPAVYNKILDNLAEIDYSQTLVWARYHEPMSDESIFANLKLARKRVPNAFLTIHSNGDYLNKQSLAKVEATGINQVRINLYMANDEEYTPENVNHRVKQLLDRTGLTLKEGGPDGDGPHLMGSSLDLPLCIPNFSTGMSSRGGLLVQVGGLQTYKRTSACLSPLQHLNIDFNGVGVLCCQVRSDAKEHKDACIGDLKQPDYTLFHFYRDLANARRGLVGPGVKEGVCKTCTVNEGGPYQLGRTDALAKPLSYVPGYGKLVSRLWKGRRRRHDPTAGRKTHA